ncbi:MAG TPA: DUF938 domain-containing protein [Gammaproteobacteria bacterium]|nr:DUF938 domain-containing protein [Gammaproteobacteria bacterium]
MTKPYSESCDQNCEPILAVIQTLLADKQAVLEIGSGTGQHAVYFARKLPHLIWHTSDRAEYHAGICQWLHETGLDNTPDPVTLDVSHSDWPALTIDVVFTANTAHIMHDKDVAAMLAGVGRLLAGDGLFILYGPINYNQQYTSESNRHFDGWLKNRDPLSGIPDFEKLDSMAAQASLLLKDDHPMPANNRILVWQKKSTG